MRYAPIMVLFGATMLLLSGALALAAWLLRKPINWEIHAND